MRLLLLGKGPLNSGFLWEKTNHNNPIGMLGNIQHILKALRIQSSK